MTNRRAPHKAMRTTERIIVMATTHTPSTLAAQLTEKGHSTTAKEVRKFLRSADGLNATVGKGARWEIDSKTAAALRKRFPKWKADQDAERAARAAAKAEESNKAAETVVEDEVDDSDIEPTDEELDTIEEETD